MTARRSAELVGTRRPWRDHEERSGAWEGDAACSVRGNRLDRSFGRRCCRGKSTWEVHDVAPWCSHSRSPPLHRSHFGHGCRDPIASRRRARAGAVGSVRLAIARTRHSGADDLALVGVGSRKGHLRARFADARKTSTFVEVEYAKAGAATFEPHPVNRTCSIGGGGVFALILPPDPSAVLRIRRPGAGNDDAWTLAVAHVSTDAEAPTVVDLR